MLTRMKSVVFLTLCCFLLSAVPGINANHRTISSVHTQHVRHHHHRGRAKKIVSVAAPIGVGLAFGPAGSIGYQGFKHRRAIKHHLVRHNRS